MGEGEEELSFDGLLEGLGEELEAVPEDSWTSEWLDPFGSEEDSATSLQHGTWFQPPSVVDT